MTKSKVMNAAVFVGLILLCVAVPLLGTFCLAMPEWTVLLPIAAFLAFAISKPKKKRSKALLAIFAAVIALIALFLTYCNPYFGSWVFRGNEQTEYKRVLTAEDAQEDLKTAWEWINKRHPAFLHGAPDYMEEAYKKAQESITEDITVNRLKKIIGEMMSPMHDAHTYVYGYFSDEGYPKDLINWDNIKVTAVNGFSRDEMIERAKAFSSYEVEEWVSVDAASPAELENIGISFPITYTLEDENGNVTQVTYNEEDFIPKEEYIRQLSEKNSEPVEEKPFVSYEIDSERSLALLTLTQCNYNKEYTDTVAEMFAEVKKQGIKNVAVDLRNNGGGNSLVVNYFIRYLPVESYLEVGQEWRLGRFVWSTERPEMKNKRFTDLTFEGNVYILTSKRSFSSAMLFAQLISDNKLGEVIGEPPANAANSYGDVTRIQLKNSGLVVSSSTKKFTRANGTEEILVMPDYPCAGNEAVDKLYELIK